VNRAPPLPVHNRFSVLEVENELPPIQPLQTEKTEIVAPKPDPLPKQPKSPRVYLRKWERRLPKKYVVAATPSPKSLVIKVEIQTTDMAEVKAGPALVDCGATGQFMNRAYVERHRLTTRKLQRPIPVFNVDGSPNEAGSIREIVDVILRVNGHTERTTFVVTNLGKQDIILGFTWLEEHNPEIDWQTRQVKMSRCPTKCHACQAKVREEQKETCKTE
jgi:hypothetical protein